LIVILSRSINNNETFVFNKLILRFLKFIFFPWDLTNHVCLFPRVVSHNRILTSVTSDSCSRFTRPLCARFTKQCRTFSGAYRLARASDSRFAATTRLRSRVFTSTRWQLWVRSRSKGLGVAWRFMIVTLQAVGGGM